MRERVFVPKHFTACLPPGLRQASHTSVMSAVRGRTQLLNYFSLLGGGASVFAASALPSEDGEDLEPFPLAAPELGCFLA